MEGSAFDRLSRIVATGGTRRSLIGLLTVLPLADFLRGSDATAARPGRKAHRHQAHHRHRHAQTQRRKIQREDAHGEACIPTGQRCPSKKPRGKHGKKLNCSHCCQGASHTEADGKQYCGCQPNGGPCTAATATSCCSGSCDLTTNTCQIPPSAPCERTCTTICCTGQCCPSLSAICHPTTGACCVPETASATCTGRCGDAVNNCGQLVTCEPCTCDPACEFCQQCNETTDTCEPDPAKDGVSCGACQACAGGTCGSCAHECCSDQCCASAAAVCHVTENTCCVPEDPAVTCDSQTCGTATNNCGQEISCAFQCAGCCDGATCVAVEDQSNEVCGSGTICINCLNSDSLCRGGMCQTCDVTCDGDPSTCGFTLQIALGGGGPATVLVCPGLYQHGFSNGRTVTVIGAGDGSDVGSNTILTQAGTDSVMSVSGDRSLTIEHVRITGGNASFGGGISKSGSGSLTLRDCTVTENTAEFSGGGIELSGSGTLTLADGTVVCGNTAPIDPQCSGFSNPACQTTCPP